MRDFWSLDWKTCIEHLYHREAPSLERHAANKFIFLYARSETERSCALSNTSTINVFPVKVFLRLQIKCQSSAEKRSKNEIWIIRLLQTRYDSSLNQNILKYLLWVDIFTFLSFSLFWVLPFLIQLLQGFASVSKGVCSPYVLCACFPDNGVLCVATRVPVHLLLLLQRYAQDRSCSLLRSKLLLSCVHNLVCRSQYIIPGPDRLSRPLAVNHMTICYKYTTLVLFSHRLYTQLFFFLCLLWIQGSPFPCRSVWPSVIPRCWEVLQKALILHGDKSISFENPWVLLYAGSCLCSWDFLPSYWDFKVRGSLRAMQLLRMHFIEVEKFSLLSNISSTSIYILEGTVRPLP